MKLNLSNAVMRVEEKCINKRVLSAALSIALSSVAVTSFAQNAAQNYVKNGDFSQGVVGQAPSDWLSWAKTSLDYLEERDGQKYLVQHMPEGPVQNASVGTFQNIDNIPGGTYSLSARVQGGGDFEWSYMQVTVVKPGGDFDTAADRTVSKLADIARQTTTGEFRNITIRDIPVVVGQRVRVTFLTQARPGTWLRIDDVQLSQQVAASPVSINVGSAAIQKFKGFGAAEVIPARHFRPGASVRTAIFDAMFKELKLRYVRFEVDPESSMAAGQYNVEKVLDSSGQSDIIREARARNSEIEFMYSVWSPPGWMKKSGLASGKNWNDANNSLVKLYDFAPVELNKLKEDKRQAFADYVFEFTQRFAEKFGKPVSYLSLQNEPNMHVDYDSAIYDRAEKQPWLANGYNLNNFEANEYAEMARQARYRLGDNSPVNILGVETVPNVAYYKSALEKGKASAIGTKRDAFDTLAVHTYGSNVERIPWDKRGGKEIFQTEYSLLEDREGSKSANHAADLAWQIVRDVGDGGASGWINWQIVEPYEGVLKPGGYREQCMGGISTSAYDTSQPPSAGLIAAKAAPYCTFTDFELTRKYFAFRAITQSLGQDATMLRTSSNDGQIVGMGFRNLDGKLGAIIVNNGDAEQQVDLSFEVLKSQGSKALTSREISATTGLTFQDGEQVRNVTVDANGQLSLRLKSKSVVTFLQNGL